MKRIHLIAASVFGVLSFSSNLLASTSMEKVLAKEPNSICKTQMISAAEQTIKLNDHRLMAMNADPAVQNEIRFVTGVISYKDRQTHVIYSASERDKQCDVSFKETFTVKVPCIKVRQEVFKKWQLLGKLNAHTFVFQNQRKPKWKGYLSDAEDGSYCLVTKHAVL